MAPEQAGGRTHDIRPSADIYPRGAIRYELHTGPPPFRAATPLDTVLQVVADEPVPPRQLQSQTPRDLETICLKCLQKEPAKRYGGAQALAEDLCRFMAREPIRARAVGKPERLWRWCRRNPAVAALSAVVAVSVLVGAGVAAFFAVEANTERQLAVDNARRANAKAIEASRHAEQARQETQRARDAKLLSDQRLYVVQMNQAHAALEAGNLGRVNQLLSDTEPELRGWEWGYFWRLCHGELYTFRGHADDVLAAAFSPDGRLLTSISEDGTVHVWDVAARRALHPAGHTGEVIAAAFSPDGHQLAFDGEGDRVRVWDLVAGRELPLLVGHTDLIRSLAFSPDGQRLASGSVDNTVRIWDPVKGQLLHTLRGHNWRGVNSVAFSPDGRRVASAGEDGTVRLWDAATGQALRTLRGEFLVAFHGVAFSPDGRRLASGHSDHSVRLWDGTTGRELRKLEGHTDLVTAVVFSPDGRRLASGSWDKTVRVWDAATGRELRTLQGHTDWVRAVAFSPDGLRLCSASLDGTVRLWASVKETVGLWDSTTDQGLRFCECGATLGHCQLAFSPDGRWVASGGRDGKVFIFDVDTGRALQTCTGHTDKVLAVAFSPDGRQVASASSDRTVRVWDAATGRVLRVLKGHTKEVRSVAFSPAGRQLASGSDDATVRVWDSATGRLLRTLTGHSEAVTAVAFDPAGRRLASASSDKTVRVWDAATGEARHVLRGHTDGITSVAFSPNGRSLASGSADHTVRIWDTAGGRELRILLGHSEGVTGKRLVAGVTGLAFSADGRRLASAGLDKVRLWDTATGQELGALMVDTSRGGSVAFGPDGRRLARTDVFGVMLYDAPPPTPAADVEREARGLVEQLLARPLTKAHARAVLQHDPALPAAVRKKALTLVGSYPEETTPNRFHDAARAVAVLSGSTPACYALALWQAETACRYVPRDTSYRTTLGVAQYRAGRYREAAATLADADAIYVRSAREPVPTVLAFLAMAQFRQGERPKARATLGRLRAAMKKPRAAKDGEAQRFAQEAEVLAGME
jgi:WD40 repeat protein